MEDQLYLLMLREQTSLVLVYQASLSELWLNIFELKQSLWDNCAHLKTNLFSKNYGRQFIAYL